MKRFLALVVTAGAAVALYATTAPAGQQAVTPAQLSALSKKVTKLQKNVKLLQQVTVALLACTASQAVPVTSSATPGETTLHVSLPNEATQFYLLGTPKECADAINSGGSLTRLRR